MHIFSDYTTGISFIDALLEEHTPWYIIQNLEEIIVLQITKLDKHLYHIDNNIAIHKSAVIESGSVLKGPMIISENCFVAAFSYLRAGVILSKKVSVGPNCEIKQSIVGTNSAIAHLNYIGNSFIASHVNIEAGVVFANTNHDKAEKEISVLINNKFINTQQTKFGSIVGSNCKIGANAVLSPGIALTANTLVPRLALINNL